MKLFVITIVSFFATIYLQSQNGNGIEKRSYYTTSIGSAEPPRIDGTIDEPVWELGEWATGFIQNEPDNGKAPTSETRFKILYDEKYLYVAIQSFDDEPEKIETRLSRRDGFAGDWVGVIFDSYFDKRSAFNFIVTAAGVKGDEFLSNNGFNSDAGWNPIWDTKTQINEQGWAAEMRIPLSQLRFGNTQEQVWGLQVVRRDFRHAERSFWQHIPADAPGWVSEFGELRGLTGLTPQKQLEIQPYLLTQLDTYEKVNGNPFRTGSDFKFTGGLDAKIGITNDLTLDLTINPDFGQVDADPGAIALDGFEIFFQELRPFFVENKNIFDYSLGSNMDNLFFSRRIGRSPQGSAYGPTVAYVDQPNNTTILGAAKFSGKTKNGWSIGVLETVTAKEFAQVIHEDNSEAKVLVEPLTNYFVGRIQKDFNDNNSFVGGIFTATNRDLQENLNHIHRNAYSGGVDFRHNWKDRTFFIDGNMVFSHVNGSEESITATQRSIVHLFQREDASHVEVDPTRTSLTGTGGQLRFGKSGGGNWRYTTGGMWRSPELEINDLGFLRQADDIRQFSNVTRVFNEPTSWYRRANITLFQSTNFDFEGNHNRTNYEMIGFINYQNNWWTEGGLIHKPRIFINTFLRGGPRWKYNEENVGYVFVGTDSRKKFNTAVGYVNSQSKQNNFSSTSYELRLNYQPLNSLGVSMVGQYEMRPNKTQYVSQQNFDGTTRYITGEIDQKTWIATLRVNYTINPNLSIQYYGQPFISRGRYSNFNYVSNSIADDLNERVTWYDSDQITLDNQMYRVDETRDGNIDYSFRKPDFAFAQFRSNLVVRWEYIPGSELFFVWSQGITGFDDASERFNTIVDNQFLNRKPENTFLIKATYRFLK
jgi:hypothetical protein